MTYADLEIGIHRWEPGSYAVELSYTRPAEAADIRLTGQGVPLVQFDFSRLLELSDAEEAYGQALTASLFGDPDVRGGFVQARNDAQTLGVLLRLRLVIGPSAPELHGLRWETLRDPASGDRLVTSRQIIFSRYLSSFDFRRVGLRPQSALRALAMVAAPSDVATYRAAGQPLSEVDRGAELALAREGLGEIPADEVPGRASLNSLSACLSHEYDILYVVCHGAVVEGKPKLWLERDDGTPQDGSAQVVPGHDLVSRLNELRVLPRLVILVSCQSAGRGQVPVRGNGDALVALGPRLAEAGVPAVLAMQGNITMQTAAAFMRVFLAELRRDGLVDRAVAAARGQVRDRPDSWMPVLFMRLSEGYIWLVPGVAEVRPGEALWVGLRRSITRGKCTPILGPGLLEAYIGPARDIARQLAEAYAYPLAPHHRDNLPQVAQYVATLQGKAPLQDEVIQLMCAAVRRRHGNDLPAGPSEGNTVQELAELLAAAGSRRRNDNPGEPYRVLAELPFKMYLTTNPDSLLQDALRECGKQPRLAPWRWREDVKRPNRSGASEPEPIPTLNAPLVIQLFGGRTADGADPLVLTEDDYFDYLIGTTRNHELLPEVLRAAMASTTLLFLGFRLDDWDFRVLFKTIMQQEGSQKGGGYMHLAVQVDPEEGRFADTRQARVFLENYFRDAKIQIYWGSTEEFARDLRLRTQDLPRTLASNR
jgi:hypothetical protein